MNSALAEMLHCLRSPENFSGNGTDMAVLERQRARLKYQQQQHFQEPQENYVTENKSIEFHLTPQFHGLINNNSMLREIANPPMNANQCLDNTLPEFGKSPIAGDEFFGERKGFATSSEIATSSCSLAAATTIGRKSLKKRKAEFVEAENCEEQRIKENAEDVESEVAEKNNLETSDTSKENSKASESQKPDYIHVRARRGQATDSHSLAERARREKIGKKMKCLQDLVPGCNKVAGKAGMLDEIINYVQSLQRQVEFLSMKLAALNPMLDVNIDEFLAKEFPAYVASFPTVATPSEMANLAYLQFNHVQQGATSCGLDVPINPPQMAIRGTTSSSLSIPEIFLDSSCFPQVQPFSTGETDLQSLYNVELH